MPVTFPPTKSPATLLPTPESSLFVSSSGSSSYSMKPSERNGLNDDETVLTGSSSSSNERIFTMEPSEWNGLNDDRIILSGSASFSEQNKIESSSSSSTAQSFSNV